MQLLVPAAFSYSSSFSSFYPKFLLRTLATLHPWTLLKIASTTALRRVLLPFATIAS
jgi:hypothetical protein